MRIWKGLALGFGEPAALAWVADSWVWSRCAGISLTDEGPMGVRDAERDGWQVKGGHDGRRKLEWSFVFDSSSTLMARHGPSFLFP